MAYCFNQTTSVEANVYRILGEQLEKALIQLTEEFSHSPASAIHDVRKCLKQARSVLRLVRQAMDRDVYQREKNSLRDMGRLLAPARDGKVHQETLDTVLLQYARVLDRSAFEGLQAWLLDLQQTRIKQLLDSDEPMGLVVSGLQESYNRLQALELKETGWDAIRPNLKRLYRQGRQRFSVAYQDGGDVAFHQWRKRVKDLGYDFRLVRSQWPPVIKAFACEADTLAQHLGDDHDVAALRSFLLHHREASAVQETQLQVLLPLMDHFQHQLRQQAYQVGCRLYAESPSKFVKRMGQYWRVWYSE